MQKKFRKIIKNAQHIPYNINNKQTKIKQLFKNENFQAAYFGLHFKKCLSQRQFYHDEWIIVKNLKTYFNN